MFNFTLLVQWLKKIIFEMENTYNINTQFTSLFWEYIFSKSAYFALLLFANFCFL